MVSTFKNLAALAEFAEGPFAEDADSIVIPTKDASTTAYGDGKAVVAVQTPGGNGLTVNINIALTLPETSDEKVFAAFFKAMREHLLTAPEA